jgi:DnaJ-domain-containing protein 1
MLEGEVLQFYNALQDEFNEGASSWQDPARLRFDSGGFAQELESIQELAKVCKGLDDLLETL